MSGRVLLHLMKALRQLGFLKLNFRQEAPPEEEDRVLTLFRNRAELKKAYGELEDEIYRLKDRIKQQEGATQRVQEMLNALETRLGMSDTGYPALVFYQLRRLWQSGRELIEQMAADLVRQQDERERRQHLAEHNRRQFSRRQAVEKELRGAESLAAEAANRVAELETERGRLTRVWHYFKRRAVEHRIAGAVAEAVTANATLTDARCCFRRAREGADAGVRGIVGGIAPCNQPCSDRVCRDAVLEACEDQACHAGARGDAASRSDRRLRFTGRV